MVEQLPIVQADWAQAGRPVERLVQEVGCDGGVVVDNVADDEGEVGLVFQFPEPGQGGVGVQPLLQLRF